MTVQTGATIGIDFGTTNSVVAVTGEDGKTAVLRFHSPSGVLTTFRSALSFQSQPALDGQPPERLVEAGPWAIEAYLDDPSETRFLQSFKTFAASAAFSETVIDGRRYKFEDMLAAFLFRLRHHAGPAMRALPGRVIVGRPVTFAGGAPDQQLALARYEAAFSRLGFSDVRCAFEPVGAAFFFARTLKADATVMVADFGGGTSDFSIVRFEQTPAGLRSSALAQSGVGVAGDAFDYRLIDQLVSPELGKGGLYRSLDKRLPIPQRYFTAFARWDQLALLRTSRDMREIRSLARSAIEPQKLERLIEILDDNLGYALYQSVSALKTELSQKTQALFQFNAGNIRIETLVTRRQFETWIAPELKAIENAVDQAMTRCALRPDQIDRIFLTGGTSLVPAVREIFHRRFEASCIETGSEFESIASGLALIGRETEIDAWSQKLISGD